MILKTYDNTLLSSKQKKGILTPDSEGYRTVPLGALGCTNTRGEFYTATNEVVALFDAYAATQSPLAGIQVKTKLLGLKDNIARTAGLKTEPTHHLLGKKVA